MFAADIKGDLSGVGAAGVAKDFISKRVEELGLSSEFSFKAYPCVAHAYPLKSGAILSH